VIVTVGFIGLKKQSFQNKSGKTQPIQTKFGIRGVVDMSRGDNVQGILGAIGPFWAKLGLGRVPWSPIFSCGNPEDLSVNLNCFFSKCFTSLQPRDYIAE